MSTWPMPLWRKILEYSITNLIDLEKKCLKQRSGHYNLETLNQRTSSCMNCASIKTALVMTLNPLIRIRPNLSITSEQKWQAFKIVMNDSRKVRSFCGGGGVNWFYNFEADLTPNLPSTYKEHIGKKKKGNRFHTSYSSSTRLGQEDLGKRSFTWLLSGIMDFFPAWAWIVDGLLLQIFEALPHAYNNAEKEKVKRQFSFLQLLEKKILFNHLSVLSRVGFKVSWNFSTRLTLSES